MRCAGNRVPACQGLETASGADRTGNMTAFAHKALNMLNEVVNAEAKL